MEYLMQDTKMKLNEEISSEELIGLIDEEIKEESLSQLKTEEDMFDELMKTEDVIKFEDAPLIPVPLQSDVSEAGDSIENKDLLKVESSNTDFKTEIIIPKVLKTVVIKLERIDEKSCVDGFNVFEGDNSSKNGDSIENKDPLKVESSNTDFKTEIIIPKVLKTVVIKLERIDEKSCVDGFNVFEGDNSSNNSNGNSIQIKTPDEVLVNKTGDNGTDESDVDNDCIESNLNVNVGDQESLTRSTSRTNVKKKYQRPFKFVCTVCEKKFTTITILREHIRIHTGERPFCCSYCNKTFRTNTLLKMHLQLHRGKRHKCAECNMRFAQVGPLNVHMRIHSNDKPFQCSKCCKTFISKTTLKKHFRNKCFSSLSVVDDVECYTCSSCKKNFKKKDYLSEHIKQMHFKRKSFPCKTCGKLSFTRSNQKKHERLHENKYDFVCQECNKSFKEKGGLTSHMQSAHSEIKPYSCDQCNSSFKLKKNLEFHNEVHHTKKNPNKYICEVCNMGFYRRTYLKRHQMAHTDSDKTLSCDVCDIKCRSKTDMERHVVTHIGGGDKPFKCNLCTMAFSRRGKMLRHQLVHSNEKPYKCDLCTKAYKDSSSLRIHINSFHLKKKFFCDRCGFKSTNESSFKKHVRNEMCKI